MWSEPVTRTLLDLEHWVGAKGGKLSVSILDLSTQNALEVNARLPVNPASNMKILTAAAVLDALGPGYRFATLLLGRRRGSEIPRLVLRGHGDPSLRSADLWRLAHALRESGVKNIGELLVDQSRFDAEFVPPAFEQQPDEWAAFRAPVSAIAVDGNTVTLHVLPSGENTPALAWLEPAGIGTLRGAVSTRAPGSGQDIRWSLAPSGTGPGLDSHLGGHVASGLPRLRFVKRVDDPRLLPGLALKHHLIELGVRVGPVALGGADAKERLLLHESEPLLTLLAALGKDSNNFYAEMLFKVLGAEHFGAPARHEDGEQAVLAWLGENQALEPGTRIENGSGLFDANRLSSSTLVKTLTVAWQSPKLGPEFVSHLAIGGGDGTLVSRFRSLGPERRIRAKTGTLHRTHALSGYVLSKSPGQRAPLVFSLLVDDLPGQHRKVRELFDRLIVALAER